jgi:general secretion pathway protein G
MKIKMKNFRKRFITLVEMMIVMFLIAMITGVIAYNYTGSLDEGKAFKTKSGMDKIRTVLDLHLATHPQEAESIESRWKGIVGDSPLVKNAGDLVNDGWGGEYKVSRTSEGEIEITSDKYKEYQANKGKGGLFNSK